MLKTALLSFIVRIVFICLAILQLGAPTALAQASLCYGLFDHEIDQLSAQDQFERIHYVHKRWLRKKKKDFAAQLKVLKRQNDFDSRALNVSGSKIKVNENEYEILLLLGHGGEGAVFLVSTPEGLATAKVFFEKSNIDVNLDLLSKRTALKSPGILDFDRDRRIVLFEYLEGIPLSLLVSEAATLRISKGDAQQILYRFENLSNSNPQLKTIEKINVIYSFATNSFYIIDPQ